MKKPKTDNKTGVLIRIDNDILRQLRIEAKLKKMSRAMLIQSIIENFENKV